MRSCVHGRTAASVGVAVSGEARMTLAPGENGLVRVAAPVQEQRPGVRATASQAVVTRCRWPAGFRRGGPVPGHHFGYGMLIMSAFAQARSLPLFGQVAEALFEKYSLICALSRIRTCAHGSGEVAVQVADLGKLIVGRCLRARIGHAPRQCISDIPIFG